MPEIRIPFTGFYNTLFSEEINQIEERDAEYFAGPESAENYEFSEKLEEAEFCELMYKHTNYSVYFQKVAEEYPWYFNEYIKDQFGIDLGLEFEEIISPREYNFTTDRIFCKISEEKVLELFHKVNDLDDDNKLKTVIEDHLKSRSGFISFYSDFVRDWENKPVLEWDYNELAMLLEMLVEQDSDYDLSIYSQMCESSEFDNARDEAFDFKAFEAAVNDLIAEKETENDPA